MDKNRLGLKNMSDLVRKEIQSIYETKYSTKKQVKEYKRSLQEITKDSMYDSKFKYVCNDLMEEIIKNCR